MKKNIVGLTLVSTLVIGFSGCAGMSPTKPLTQDQKRIPKLHFGYEENQYIVAGALKLAEKQAPRVGYWQVQVKQNYINFGSYTASYTLDKQNMLAIQSDFEKDGSYLKANRPNSEVITQIDNIQNLLPTSIAQVDQMCFEYKNNVEKNNVEIEKSERSALLPQKIQDAMISDNTMKFNIYTCGDLNALQSYKQNIYNYNQRFNYGGYYPSNFKVEGYKSIDWSNGSTKLSLSEISYNYFRDGLVAENEDLVVDVSYNTYVKITNKTNNMITLSGISTYYGKDISTNSYDIILAPHSVNTIGHQLKGNLYKSVQSEKDPVSIGIAAKYKINEYKTLLKVEERTIN
jgi:hypothetical protein